VSSSDLRASITGKDLPEDIKSRLLALHEENVNLKESAKTAQERLAKAKAVCLPLLCIHQANILTFALLVHKITG
jgi:hypothetical protein